MPAPAIAQRPRLPVLLVGGLLAWIGAMVWAHGRLPEWQLSSVPDRQQLQRTMADAAARCGIRLLGRSPTIELAERSRTQRVSQEYPFTSAPTPATVILRVSEEGVLVAAPAAVPYTFTLWVDPKGRPQSASWRPSNVAAVVGLRLTASQGVDALAPALLEPGERLGPAHVFSLSGLPMDAFDILGAQPPASILASNLLQFVVSRNPGAAAELASDHPPWQIIPTSVKRTVTQTLVLAIVVMFCILAIRRRISIVNALWIALLCGLPIAAGLLAKSSGWGMFWSFLYLAAETLGVALLWAAAESLWRVADPQFDSRLDALRMRQLSPWTAQALTLGIGFGLVTAALSVASLCLASTVRGSTLDSLSVDLPILSGSDGPIFKALFVACCVAFLIGAGRRFGVVRGAIAATLVGAAVLSPVHIQPAALDFGFAVVSVGALVIAGLSGGPLTLLTAAFVAHLLPAALFSGEHAAAIPGSLLLSAGFLLAIVVTTVVSQLKAAPTAGALPPPSFIVRLEGERRREVEMDLVARMQRGLLPRSLPRISGWEVAARSELADRAGGDLYDVLLAPDGHWWIAAGDVAGHGVSCAISQAIVKATLVGLLTSPRAFTSPGETLEETDRVLRATAPERSFTSVVLMRFDPVTGTVVLANAGHPYPLLVEPGQRAREITIPGLPLGQGPNRRYDDTTLQLTPGSVMVLCSDGLIEARAPANGAPYGFDRPLDHLASIASRHADDILDDLFLEWHAFRGPGAPDDDTTVVVLRRLPAGARDTWAPPVTG